MRKQRKIHLRPIFEEAVGILKELETGDFETTLILSCTRDEDLRITLPAGPEAYMPKKSLNHLIGQKIGVLRTDNPQKPFIIKTFNETTAAQNVRLALLWLRRSILCVAFKGVPSLEDSFCRNHDRYTSNKSYMHVNWPVCARIY